MPEINLTRDLTDIAGQIDNVRAGTSDIASSLASLADQAQGAGHPVAAQALESFLATWSGEVGRMNGDAEILSQHLDASQVAYVSTDQAIREGAE